MSFYNGELSAADVAAVTKGNNGMFGSNDGGYWILILFLFAMMGGWGNGYGANGGANATVPAVQAGFDQAAVMNGINALNTNVSNGFANAEVSRCNSQANLMQTLNNISMAQQNCCCDNRLGIANLGSQIAADGCSTRQTFNDIIRDMIMANYQNSQAQIAAVNAVGDRLDNKLCQLEMDGKNDRIAELQRQVEEANDQARYNGLIAAFNQSQDAQTTTLEQYLAPTPRPAYMVQNPNCCPQFGNCVHGM